MSVVPRHHTTPCCRVDIGRRLIDRLGLWYVPCSGYGRVTKSGGIPCSEHGVLDIVGNRGTTQALEWCDTVPRSREDDCR